MITDTEKLAELIEAADILTHSVSSVLMIAHMNSKTLHDRLPHLIDAYEKALAAGLIEATIPNPTTLNNTAHKNMAVIERLNTLNKEFSAKLRDI